MNELYIDGVHAAYSKKEVLVGLSLKAAKGQILAMIGPNGAGKSTVLKVIAGLLRPQKGRVLLDGRDISALPVHERAALGIGYSMQGGRVFQSLTVAENLEMVTAHVPAEDREERLRTALDTFPRLDDALHKKAGLLSGGERQSLSVAMTFVMRPALLLLDEPSAGFSPRLVGETFEKIQTLNKEWGMTILLVEQNVREALGIAHRAVALVNGEVLRETNDPEKWLDEGELEELFLRNGAAVSESNSKNDIKEVSKND